MSLELKGKVISIEEIKSGAKDGKDWTSQDFIVETSGEYPKKVCFNCYKKPVPKLNENVNVFFEPESREYNGKWFTTLKVWKFEVEGMTVQQPQQLASTAKRQQAQVDPSQGTLTPNQESILPDDDGLNDLPF